MNSSGLLQLGTLATVLAASALSLTQQNKSTLQIDSPPDGTVVNPGQTVSVRVTSPSGAVFTNVVILGEDPLGWSEVARSVPAQFSVRIPSKIPDCRKYGLKAMGNDAAGELVEAWIDIDVERPDTPISISSFQFPRLTLEARPKGRAFNLIILATFSDGSNIAVTESSYVTYQSSNTAVAAADGLGGITAVAPGTASIKVTYKNPQGGSVQVSVPVTVVSPDEN
jgi:hypothetical protein